jgi:phage terminase large subunit GpA-like protein
LWPINVDDAKTEIYSALAIPSAGPNAYHFPFHLETVDEEFFAQLCAEHKETVYNKSGVATHTVWVQDRERNEVLDNAVLCLAAFKLLNPNIRQMAQILVTTPVEPTANEPGPPVPGGAAAAPRARRRRSSRSPYLP